MPRSRFLRSLLTAGLVLSSVAPPAALASGPRYLTGPPFFPGQQGLAIGWRQPQLFYFTDPGDLSPAVDHAAADALVAAAAGVWNVPVANISIAQGGALAEHVSSQNAYLDSGGMEWPADVASTNFAAVPLAIVYDSDGSVTETLLGAGASDPAECRTNAVTESVDRFNPEGYIEHALIVLNGRCTSTAPETRLEMQYKLERAFGRVLGLAWTQTNDNVFTGSPAPTYQQALHWPILHPIDIICGAYSYQCLPQPFQLRDDDLAGLVAVYPVTVDPTGRVPAGKQESLAGANSLFGVVSFPTGEGMAGVNVLARRESAQTGVDDGWFEASAVTGQRYRRGSQAPFLPPDTSPLGSMGTTDPGALGGFAITYLPLSEAGGGAAFNNLIGSTEPVNLLYAGGYSLGPYAAGVVAPSGAAPAPVKVFTASAHSGALINFRIGDAGAVCATANDGTAAAPVAIGATGWWTGLICGVGHAAYSQTQIRAGRSFTVEVTALDASGLPTGAKLMPVIGLFAASDGPGAAPSAGMAAAAFNGLGRGMTTATGWQDPASGLVLRIAIADQRGDGRPDFAYQARLFYADALAPAQIGSEGGQITITGVGFRRGNAVTVNGVRAPVLSATANELVVQAPTLAAAFASSGNAIDVMVIDLGTGATSVMTGALTYAAAAPTASAMKLISAPSGTMYAGDASTVPFAVQVVAADGRTPVPGETVLFTAQSGALTGAAGSRVPAQFGACGGPTCAVITDAQGVASTTATGLVAGALTLVASDGALSEQANVGILEKAGSLLVLDAPAGRLPTGAVASPVFRVRSLASDGVTGLAGRTIVFTVPTGAAVYAGCNASTCTATTDYWGAAQVAVTPAAAGTVTLQAADGAVAATASFEAYDAPDVMQVIATPRTASYVGESPGEFGIRLLRADGTPDRYVPVTFSAPDGVLIYPCAASVCTVTTNSNAETGAVLGVQKAGTFTVQASFGGVSQSASFTVSERTLSLIVLTSPEDGVQVGRTARQVFSAQLIGLDGVTPLAGQQMVLSGPQGQVLLDACGESACLFTTDAQGIASTPVTLLQPGRVTLSAVYSVLSATASFTAVGKETILFTEQPDASGLATGQTQSFGVQVLQPDGVTPFAGRDLLFSVTSGAFSLVNCGYNFCGVATDAQGHAEVHGIGFVAGPVSLQVTDGTVTEVLNFNVIVQPDSIRLVSSPADGSYAGEVAPLAFTVQVLRGDGVTPAAGRSVAFSVTSGSAALSGCAALPCLVSTDSAGMASVQVTPSAAGVVTLQVADGAVSRVVSFSAVTKADVLRVVSIPASGGYAGDPASPQFAVRVFAGDGVTPVAGKKITFSVTNGSATWIGCPGSVCMVPTDATGLAAAGVIPANSGSIGLLAADGAVTVAASFTAVAKPEVLRLVSAPAGTAFVGEATPAAFSVQVLQADGVTPVAGRTVTLSVTTGSAGLAGCAAAPCALVSDLSGIVAVRVTPLAAGTVGLLAVSGSASLAASFTAEVKPDVLRVVSTPANGSLVGDHAAPAFAVQVFAGDGVTPAAGRMIQFTVTGGAATLEGCAVSPCTVTSDAQGIALASITPTSAGVISLLAAEGAITQTVSFTAAAKPDVLQLVSVPADGTFVGDQAASPFSVRVVAGDGVTPVAGKLVTFSVTSGSAQLAGCGTSPCAVTSDAAGLARVLVTPQAAGRIGLLATYGSLTQAAQFSAQWKADVVKVVSAPQGGGFVGEAATPRFTVQVLLGDGATPLPGRNVVFSVTGGRAALGGCDPAAPCVATTDAQGMASVSATPLAAGAVTLTVADAAITQSVTFFAVARPDVLAVVTAPAARVYEGASAGVLQVMLTTSDGATPRAGVPVRFTAGGSGAVSFAGCGAGPCVVATDAAGLASIAVQGTLEGAATVTASVQTGMGVPDVSADIAVVRNVFAMNAATAPMYLAAGAVQRAQLEVTALKNGQAAPAQTVHWTGSSGFAVDVADTLTDARGGSPNQVVAGPVAGGGQASATACAWTTICVQFQVFGVGPEDQMIAIVSGGQQAVANGAGLGPLVAQVLDGAGHPVASAPVSVYQTVTAVSAECPATGRCPTAPVLLSRVTVVDADAAGQVSIEPLSVNGVATQTEIALAAGSQGFVTAVLSSRP